MAKKQELALNPAKISGVCGRLMCCLVFEYDIYDEIKKDTNELRNIEKPPPTEGGQISMTPSSGIDSAVSTEMHGREEGKEGDATRVEPKAFHNRRKRRRRRRKRIEK